MDVRYKQDMHLRLYRGVVILMVPLEVLKLLLQVTYVIPSLQCGLPLARSATDRILSALYRT